MDFSVLREKQFLNLWLGQTISQVGDGFYYILFMFMVSKVTGSSAIVGLVGALEALPFLIFGAYAGVLADRIDRRRIMMISDLASGAALLAFGFIVIFSTKPPVWSLLLMPFLLSSARCLFMPAKSAAIPSLVPVDLVVKANALSNFAFTGTQLIGLSGTAIVISLLYTLSPTVFYASSVCLNALSFFVSAAFIRKLPRLLPDRENPKEAHPMEDFKAGLAYIRSRRELVILTVVGAFIRLMISPFFVVYLAVNLAWFGGKPQLLAWMEFSFFAGMVVGTAAMTRVKVNRPMAWFTYGITIVGACVSLMAFASWFPLFVTLNVLSGLALPLADVPVPAYLQVSVPDAFRGRVNSVREMLAQGVVPVGIGLGGVVVERYGFVVSFLIMGLGMMVPCLIAALDRSFYGARMPVTG